jgi:hypothetical protein
MTGPITSGDPMLALAVLMLDGDERLAKLDAENLAAARAEQQRALEQQVSLMHEAADDIRLGAVVEGALSVGGAALSTAGCVSGPAGKARTTTQSWLGGGGQAASALAKPLGALLGSAPRADAEAEAKRAEADAADARARAEEALHQRDRAEQTADKTLEALGATLESEAQGRLALIANV